MKRRSIRARLLLSKSRYANKIDLTLKEASDFIAEPAATQMSSHEKIRKLEDEIVSLRSELEELKQAFAEFKAQF